MVQRLMDANKGRPSFSRIDPIQHRPHLGIAGRVFNAIPQFEIRSNSRFRALFIKFQQRRIF
jgi:hypothetical protein